ncbi:BTAD domain-containing putative transcriptional regulator [Streptomyces sp. DT190]|uniref:AfsR/SARP family transcriptional regulator n=1 Tax=unclassified Streptomyces TaxID=2593676 RepID=UPI003CE6F92E
MSTRYEFKVLGPLEVLCDGRPLRIDAAKVRLLLAALLADANQVVTVETLIHRLWGENPPGRARNTLQNYVLRLRRALGSAADGAPVLTRPHGYLVETAPDALDLHRFTALVRQGRAALAEGAAARAAPLLREALGLWRGEPLSDLPAHGLQGVVAALNEQRLYAWELRIDADLALGRAADVLPELRGLVGAHPLREHFWAQRMLALFDCGRQGEALASYREVTALLSEELGVAPGAELRQVHQRLLAAAPNLDEAPAVRTAPSTRVDELPVEMTTFVGREAELAEVRRLLGAARLVTLTGVGGVGKTRLALRVAADVAPSFADGVRLADLAPLSDPDLLDRAVSEALGLRDQSARPAADAIVSHLRDRRLLLVLDNCEHLVEHVAALVLRLARAAPGLRVLATSRQRLGAPGEHVLTVPSLTLPDADERADGSPRAGSGCAARAAAGAGPGPGGTAGPGTGPGAVAASGTGALTAAADLTAATPDGSIPGHDLTAATPDDLTAGDHAAPATPDGLTAARDLAVATPDRLTAGDNLAVATPDGLTADDHLAVATPANLTTGDNLAVATPDDHTTGDHLAAGTPDDHTPAAHSAAATPGSSAPDAPGSSAAVRTDAPALVSPDAPALVSPGGLAPVGTGTPGAPGTQAVTGTDDPLLRSEAVRLLMDRAAGSAPAFRLTARNRRAVAQLCLRLDGIPLAIELAAVRLSAMTAEEIVERLDDRFRLLSVPQPRTSARYRLTLRGVVDWSYDLCTEGERLLWNRLSVFSGGFDLEAAETVCAGEGVARTDVLDLLAGLVDKSIVAVSHSGDRTRYSLLETIRQYGRQRLLEAGEATRLRVRHCEYYRLTAVRAGHAWCGPREVDWLLRLRTELPNLRTALDYCAGRHDLAVAGVEIAVNLARTRCWFFSSTLGEGRHWLERLLATGPDGPWVQVEPALVVGALAMKAWIALCQGDNPASERFLAECRAGARESADGSPSAPLTYIEGAHAMLVRGDPASIPLLAVARDRFRALGQGGDAHMATMLWAMAEAFLGTRASASAARDVYVAEAEASGAEWARTWAQWCTGLVELRHGAAERALSPLRAALVRQRAIGDSWGPVWGLETLAWAVAATGDGTRAAWLLGAAHRLRQDTGVALIGLRPFHEAHVAAEERVRALLGSAEYTAAWSRGAAADDPLRHPRDGAEFRG